MSILVPVPPAPPLPPINPQGVTSSGPVTFSPDATYDLGSAGARPNNINAAGNATIGGSVSATSGSFAGGVSTGNVAFTAPGTTLRSGSGAPGTGMGNVGDFYFRTDTPGTANQRLYVKTGASVWTAIL